MPLSACHFTSDCATLMLATHGKLAQRSTKDQLAYYISDLAWARLAVGPAELLKISEKHGVSIRLRATTPVTLLKGRAGMKINKLNLSVCFT